MNIVDSSAWLEFFADGPNAEYFSSPILDTKSLIVPAVSILEVFKRVLQQRDEGAALQAVALMQQGRVIDLDASLAMLAARLGIQHKLPLADSIILATGRQHEAIVWTQDADFEGLAGVNFRRKVTTKESTAAPEPETTANQSEETGPR